MCAYMCICALCSPSVRFRFVPRDNVAGAIGALSTKYQISYRDDSFRGDTVAALPLTSRSSRKTFDIARAKNNAKSEVHKLMRIQLGVDQVRCYFFETYK